MTFVPAHHVLPAEERPPRGTVFVLHGILGSLGNWRGFVRRFAAKHRGWAFVLVDLRNHGDSTPCPGPHTVEAAALDVVRLAERLGCRPDVIWGHSFGGKVALEMTRHAPVGSVWALDAPPGRRGADDLGEVARLVATLRSLPRSFGRRELMVEALTERGIPPAISRWMTTNLRAVGAGGYGWRFDLDGVEAMLQDYARVDRWDVVEGDAGGAVQVNLVVAGESDRWSAGDRARLASLASRGRIGLRQLHGAGHWVHVDAPEALASVLAVGLEEGGP